MCRDSVNLKIVRDCGVSRVHPFGTAFDEAGVASGGRMMMTRGRGGRGGRNREDSGDDDSSVETPVVAPPGMIK
jgi:hypothetical protein